MGKVKMAELFEHDDSVGSELCRGCHNDTLDLDAEPCKSCTVKPSGWEGSDEQ